MVQTSPSAVAASAAPTAAYENRHLVRVEKLEVRFGQKTILKNVDLGVAPGEIVSLIGPNGSGKTTLVRAILGLVKPLTGRVVRQDDLIIGYVPQQFSVDPILPLTVRRFLAFSRRANQEAILESLAEVGAGTLLEAQLHDLSGGELQRVLLARALLRRPQLLVLDEPLQGVDVGGQVSLFDRIARLRDQRGCGVLMVSHDLHLVMGGTDHVVCLNRHVCCSGKPEAVGRHPEYLSLFGPRAAASLAVYTHHHDHRHALSGDVLQEPAAIQSESLAHRHD